MLHSIHTSHTSLHIKCKVEDMNRTDPYKHFRVETDIMTDNHQDHLIDNIENVTMTIMIDREELHHLRSQLVEEHFKSHHRDPSIHHLYWPN
jgi:hypothetical protein